MYLYGVLSVAVIGAAGNPHDDGWTDARVIGDRLGDQAGFYLMALPLMAATIGWAAAAATARLRHVQPTIAAPAPLLIAPGPDPVPTGAPRTTKPESHPTRADHPVPAGPHPPDGAPSATPATATRQRRTWYPLLLCAALAAAAFLVFLTFLSPHRR